MDDDPRFHSTDPFSVATFIPIIVPNYPAGEALVCFDEPLFTFSKLFLSFLSNSPRLGLSFFLSQLIKPEQLHSYRKPRSTHPLIKAVRREGGKREMVREREMKPELKVIITSADFTSLLHIVLCQEASQRWLLECENKFRRVCGGVSQSSLN